MRAGAQGWLLGIIRESLRLGKPAMLSLARRVSHSLQFCSVWLVHDFLVKTMVHASHVGMKVISAPPISAADDHPSGPDNGLLCSARFCQVNTCLLAS